MSEKIRQPFTPGGKFIVSRPFRFHGRNYRVGDEFPWRTLSCSVRKLRQLYEGRFLNGSFLSSDEFLKTTEVDETDEVSEINEDENTDEENEDNEDENTDEENDEDDESLIITHYDPDVHEVVNPVKGEWYIDDNGVHQVRIVAKEAKRLRKQRKITEINSKMIVKE